MKPTFFAAAADFRRWLEQHHATAAELWVGYFKKSSGRGGMVYAEAVDEALCFGWIDGLTKSLDAERYMQRFTPRKPTSNWSNLNVRHIARLKAAGRMHPAGLAAFAARKPERTGVYSFEALKTAKLAPDEAKRFHAKKRAWAFFTAQAPSYQRRSLAWIVSAKQAATRTRRLARLIAASAERRRL